MSDRITTPWLTLLLSGAAVAVFIGNDVANIVAGWAYQRDAILDGEVWRVFTGHLTHHSPRHLVMNLLAFAVLAIITECQLGHARFAGLLAVLGAFISLVLLLFVPAMTTYAGISGINYGLLTYLGLRHLSRVAMSAGWSMFAVYAFVAAVMSVLLWQQAVKGSSPFTGELNNVQVAWQAHLAGASAAALLAAKRHDRPGFPGARG